MLFHTGTFAIFLAILLPLYFASGLKWQNRLLFVGSYIFYGWWDWRFLALLVISTIIDFDVGVRLGSTADPLRRKLLMLLSTCGNLGLLGVFKYFDFFSQSAADLLNLLGMRASPFLLDVVLPVGISFYTFQTLAYTLGVYRRQFEPCRNLLNFALFVAYFPQLVAGPIERAENLLPQLERPRRVDNQMLWSGSRLILQGLFKKMAVADAVAPFVDEIFTDPARHPGPTLLAGGDLFALQIYGDFSGYTDMARGVSRVLGIELMLNFRQPYLSTNISEFWRRWHISLSVWLRDNVYIPLGGNRKGAVRTRINLMATMLIGGFWHGAGWTYIIWGGLHGLYLSAHKLMLDARAESSSDAAPMGLPSRIFKTVFTFHLVCLTWIFFRAKDLSAVGEYLAGLGSGWSQLNSYYLLPAVFYVLLVLLLDWACWYKDRESPVDSNTPWILRACVYAVMVAMILWVGSAVVVPFIYFQF